MHFLGISHQLKQRGEWRLFIPNCICFDVVSASSVSWLISTVFSLLPRSLISMVNGLQTVGVSQALSMYSAGIPARGESLRCWSKHLQSAIIVLHYRNVQSLCGNESVAWPQLLCIRNFAVILFQLGSSKTGSAKESNSGAWISIGIVYKTVRCVHRTLP